MYAIQMVNMKNVLASLTYTKMCTSCCTIFLARENIYKLNLSSAIKNILCNL